MVVAAAYFDRPVSFAGRQLQAASHCEQSRSRAVRVARRGTWSLFDRGDSGPGQLCVPHSSAPRMMGARER